MRLHARGLRGTVLARKASTPGLTTLTVRAPEPAPAPLPDAAGHVFPVNGPHTYGDAFGAPRNGYAHQGQDILAAEGMPVVAPVAGSISFTDYQAKAAGYYIVEKGSDGYDYFFAHCQKGSTVVAPAQVVLGRPAALQRRAPRATRLGRICTSRLGRADGGSMRVHTPSTRCRC